MPLRAVLFRELAQREGQLQLHRAVRLRQQLPRDRHDEELHLAELEQQLLPVEFPLRIGLVEDDAVFVLAENVAADERKAGVEVVRVAAEVYFLPPLRIAAVEHFEFQI